MHNKNKETRKQKRLEVLGSNNPTCVVCGENNYCCLEQHHVAEKAYGDDVCNICRNCHRKLSDNQKDHPKKVNHLPTENESFGHFLLGLADLFSLLVKRFRFHGQLLIQKEKEEVSKK